MLKESIRNQFSSIILVLMAAFVLSSCERETSWRQRLTIVIETPSGEVRGSSVTEVVKTETKGGWVLPDARGVRAEVMGEAVAIEIMPGRWLFALLGAQYDLGGNEVWKRGATHWVYPTYGLVTADSHSVAMRLLLSQPHDVPVPLPPEVWPLMVTFDDITQPQTIRLVDPTDLSPLFGEGVRISAVTIEITDSPTTISVLDKLLPWLGPHPEPSLGPPTEGVTVKNAPLYVLVHMGDFIRRAQ